MFNGLTDDFAKHSVFEYLPAMQRLVKPLRTLGISQIGCIFLDPPYHVQYLGDSELFFNEWLNTGDDTFKYDAFLSPAMSTPGWHLLAPYMALPDTDVMRNILDLCAIEVGAAYINYVQGQKQVFIFCSDQPIKFYDLFFNRCDLLTQFLLYAHKELTLLRQHSNTFCLNDDIRQGLSENFSLAKGLQLQDIQQDFFGDMNAVMTKLESFINFYQLNSAESSCCYQLASGMPILNIAEQLDTDVWQVQRLINRLRKKTHFVSVDELKLKLQFMEH